MTPETKVGFEPHANVNGVQIAYGSGLLELTNGETYETSDPGEIAVLDEHPAVKRAEKSSAKKTS